MRSDNQLFDALGERLFLSETLFVEFVKLLDRMFVLLGTSVEVIFRRFRSLSQVVAKYAVLNPNVMLEPQTVMIISFY